MKPTFACILVLVIGVLLADAVTPPVPMKCIYIDYKNINYNAPEQTVLAAADAGFNMIILAFYLSASGAADMAQVWAGLPDATKISTMANLHARGVYVLVSFGGGTDSPYSLSPTTLGQQVSQFVITHHLDGVDFDLENFANGMLIPGKTAQQTIDWLVAISSATRTALGSNRFISHAPQGPYFGPLGASNTFAGPLGGYTGMYNAFPDIDFFLVQFYNQGTNCYVDYAGIFNKSCTTFPSTSIGELVQQGIPLNKIILGKPVTAADAGNGYVAPATLNTFLTQAATEYGYNAGVFGWLWQDTTLTTNWVSVIFTGVAAIDPGSTSISGSVPGVTIVTTNNGGSGTPSSSASGTASTAGTEGAVTTPPGRSPALSSNSLAAVVVGVLLFIILVAMIVGFVIFMRRTADSGSSHRSSSSAYATAARSSSATTTPTPKPTTTPTPKPKPAPPAKASKKPSWKTETELPKDEDEQVEVVVIQNHEAPKKGLPSVPKAAKPPIPTSMSNNTISPNRPLPKPVSPPPSTNRPLPKPKPVVSATPVNAEVTVAAEKPRKPKPVPPPRQSEAPELEAQAEPEEKPRRHHRKSKALAPEQVPTTEEPVAEKPKKPKPPPPPKKTSADGAKPKPPPKKTGTDPKPIS